jgi:hypothetical protein
VIAIGYGIFWAGYTLGIWGYCLVKSYDVPFTALFASSWPGAQAAETAPAGGHQLGTITGNAQVTDPGQLQAGLGG